MSEIMPEEIMGEYEVTELEAREISAFMGLFSSSQDECRAWLERIAASQRPMSA